MIITSEEEWVFTVLTSSLRISKSLQTDFHPLHTTKMPVIRFCLHIAKLSGSFFILIVLDWIWCSGSLHPSINTWFSWITLPSLSTWPHWSVFLRLLDFFSSPPCPNGSDGKESARSAGDPGSISGLGRFPGGGYSCLENPRGQRSLVGCSPWGHKESDTTEQLSTHTPAPISSCWNDLHFSLWAASSLGSWL